MMRRARWSRPTALVAMAAILLVGAVGVAAEAPVQAAAECPAEDPGTELPVILVHGFNSNPDIWDKALDRFETASTYVTAFDYSSHADRWVTNENIGPALADRILCLARASNASGGAGKVAVVAHSMGGLAMLCAADETCSGREGVAERLAGVVTLGTPYTGSFLRPGQAVSAAQDLLASRLSGACRLSDFVNLGDMSGLCETIAHYTTSEASRAFAFGSDELRALPGLPSGVPWRNIAGQVRVTTQLFWKTYEVNGDVGDLVVGTDSAQAIHSNDDLGGSRVLGCGTVNLATLGPGMRPQLPTCDHVRETSDDAFLAQAQSAVTNFRDDTRGSEQWTELVLTPLAAQGVPASGGLIQETAEIIRNRLDSAGVHARVEVYRSQQIQVAMPGPPVWETLMLILASDHLGFRPVLLETAPDPIVDVGSSGTQDPETGIPAVELSDTPRFEPTSPSDLAWITPAVERRLMNLDCTDPANQVGGGGGDSLRATYSHGGVDPSRALVACSESGLVKYVLGPLEISGTEVAGAQARQRSATPNASPDEWVVEVDFTPAGTTAVGVATQRLLDLPPPQDQLAIVFDGVVISAPSVNSPITGGTMEVSALTADGARSLASLLSRAYPIKLEVRSIRQLRVQ